jgi:hypothetical protein
MLILVQPSAGMEDFFYHFTHLSPEKPHDFRFHC